MKSKHPKKRVTKKRETAKKTLVPKTGIAPKNRSCSHVPRLEIHATACDFLRRYGSTEKIEKNLQIIFHCIGFFSIFHIF